MTNEELKVAALAAGWTYKPALLYDEEGIEGYEWTGPAGESLYAVDVPSEFAAMFDPAAKAAETNRKESVKSLGKFIESLFKRRLS